MAKARLIHLLRIGLLASVGAWGAGCTVYPSTPSQPAFDTDVLPIFQSHCIRCHGAGPPDGGPHPALNPLNLNPGSAVNYDGGQSCYLLTAGQFARADDAGIHQYSVPDLTRFGPCQMKGVCNPRLGGAGAYAGPTGPIETDVHMRGNCSQMPPPPAPVLDDWELKVIDAWTAESTPICSNSANPDPSLLCP
jgi:hypothetical protein